MPRSKDWTGAHDYLVFRLKEARLAAGYTQSEVATRFERPQSFVSKIETSNHGVNAVDLMLFARMYGKPMAYFMNDYAAVGGG